MIYVIETDNREVKIGITKNLKNRMRAFSTANYLKPIVVATYVNADDDRNIDRFIEKEAHSLLADRRANGEWFAVPIETAQLAVEMAADKLRYRIFKDSMHIKKYDFSRREISQVENFIMLTFSLIAGLTVNLLIIANLNSPNLPNISFNYPEWLNSLSNILIGHIDILNNVLLYISTLCSFVIFYCLRHNIDNLRILREVSRYEADMMREYLEWRELDIRSLYKPKLEMLSKDGILRKNNKRFLHLDR